MNKQILAIICIFAILVLSACSASQNSADQSASAGNQTGQLETGSGLSVLQLALGTFKLDQTDTPIDAQEAEELLPLWKALRSLSQNDTTAAEELQALITQIQSTMTPEQVNAIQKMNLSMQDVQSISQELGLGLGAGGGAANGSADSQANTQTSGTGSPPAGDFGGGPDGIAGAGGPPSAGVDTQAIQTALSSSNSGGLGVNDVLLGEVINFLTAKT